MPTLLNEPSQVPTTLSNPFNGILIVREILEQVNTEIVLWIRYDARLQSPCEANVDFSENNFFLLRWHYEILCLQLEFHNFNYSIDYSDFVQSLSDYVENYLNPEHHYELKLTLNSACDIQIEAYEAVPRLSLLSGFAEDPNELVLDVYMDVDQTLATPYTTFTTNERRYSERAMTRLRQIAGPKEDWDRPKNILLVSSNGEVMGCPDMSVAFYRNGCWVTPSIASGCTLDPLREALLSIGEITEAAIPAEQVALNEEVLLFNSIIGVARGVIVSLTEPLMKKTSRAATQRADLATFGQKNGRKKRTREQQLKDEAAAKKNSIAAGKVSDRSVGSTSKLPPGCGAFHL